MYKKILLPYDGSESSKIALERLIEFLPIIKGEIILLAVGRIPDYAETVSEIEEAEDQANRYYSKILSEAAQILQEKGITPQTLIKYGRPGDVIIKTAEELQADLIVLGTKKHPTLLNKRTIGPIADKVVEHAHCSVLVVR
jgi:nucleotide-binding universal stress UspA family protein